MARTKKITQNSTKYAEHQDVNRQLGIATQLFVIKVNVTVAKHRKSVSTQ